MTKPTSVDNRDLSLEASAAAPTTNEESDSTEEVDMRAIREQLARGEAPFVAGSAGSTSDDVKQPPPVPDDPEPGSTR